MPRFDKVEPKGGSFRAPLNFAIPDADVGKVFGVGLDTNGRVVKGAGNTGVRGVVCASSPMSVGEPIDCMTDGEIVDMTGLTAGTTINALVADGTIGTAAGTNVGYTVESWRLIVRVAR